MKRKEFSISFKIEIGSGGLGGLKRIIRLDPLNPPDPYSILTAASKRFSFIVEDSIIRHYLE